MFYLRKWKPQKNWHLFYSLSGFSLHVLYIPTIKKNTQIFKIPSKEVCNTRLLNLDLCYQSAEEADWCDDVILYLDCVINVQIQKYRSSVISLWMR